MSRFAAMHPELYESFAVQGIAHKMTQRIRIEEQDAVDFVETIQSEPGDSADGRLYKELSSWAHNDIHAAEVNHFAGMADRLRDQQEDR